MKQTIIYDFADIQTDNNTAIISKNTANTWQPDRKSQEIYANTEQGKIAENAVIKYIEEFSSDVKYLPYDKFRADNFEKHAPFDGLIYNKNVVCAGVVETFTKKINDFIAKNNSHGKISNKLRKELQDNNIYTVEIKSTKVNDKKHSASNISTYKNLNEVQLLINEILKDDFLTYPLYLRMGNKSWEQYCEYCKDFLSSFKELDGEELYNSVKDLELSCMDNFYIRCYVDYKFDKVLILGFIDKEDFMNPPYIKKMPQWGKSENALYFAKNLKYRKSLKELLKLLS